jgi:RNA polymerase-binding transcription factor DksA
MTEIETTPPDPEDYGRTLAQAEQLLDDIDQALARLSSGTYGQCEVCGENIDPDRLLDQPTARTCGQDHVRPDHAASAMTEQ